MRLRWITAFSLLFGIVSAQNACDYPVLSVQGDTSFNITEPTIIRIAENIINFSFLPSKDEWQLKSIDSCIVISSYQFDGQYKVVSEDDKLNGICYCEHCTKNILRFENSSILYLIIPKSSLNLKIETVRAKDLIPKKWYEKPFNKGQEIPLDEIFFVAGTDKLLRSSFDELEQLLKVLQSNPNLKIEIQGHVNGPFSKNKKEFQELSEARAKAVMNWLIEKGISADRLTSNGYGNSKMIYPEAMTDDEMAANRRVRILIREI